LQNYFTTSSDGQSTEKTEIFLVTGATGNVASEVVKQLAKARESNIKEAVRSDEKVSRVKYDMIEPIQIDYYRPETLREAVRDVEKVFLLTPFQFDKNRTQHVLNTIKINHRIVASFMIPHFRKSTLSIHHRSI
jgi:uncharacterized protein YbjT (DUF2867 family)